MKDFKTLKVWQKSHLLTLAVYKVTLGFPKSEIYGLTSQTRRASASISANIAEGCGRHGDVEFCRFLQIAAGSASELEYHLLLAHDLDYVDSANYDALNQDVNEVKRMLNTFIKTLKSSR